MEYTSALYYQVGGGPDELISAGAYYYPVQISSPFPSVNIPPVENPEW